MLQIILQLISKTPRSLEIWQLKGGKNTFWEEITAVTDLFMVHEGHKLFLLISKPPPYLYISTFLFEIGLAHLFFSPVRGWIHRIPIAGAGCRFNPTSCCLRFYIQLKANITTRLSPKCGLSEFQPEIDVCL